MFRCVKRQLPFNPNVKFTVFLLKLPGVNFPRLNHALINTAVLHQIAWRLRGGAPGEILRGSYSRHAQFRANGYGYHIFVDSVSEPHAGIKTIRNDIPEAVVGIKLNMNIRIFA